MTAAPARHEVTKKMATPIAAHITGNVWKILVKVGDTVSDLQELMILESMKMEIPVESSVDGTVLEIRVAEGAAVNEGDVLVVIG